MSSRSTGGDQGSDLDDTIDLGSVRLGAGLDDVPTGGSRYALGDILGEGGMGEVLGATDHQIGREVAIKRMRNVSAGSTARFLREARIQGRLDHPAIVPVHEVSIDEAGRPFFVMKRLAGTTLQAILATGEGGPRSGSGIERYSRQRLLRAFADVCLAVEFAHTRGVVHRDLKPANIMLGDFGEVYVLDWGVARVLDDDEPARPMSTGSSPGMTEAGAVLGTLGYMAPEQARGDEVGRAADVYALGCILFEILAGQPLHRRGALAAMFEDYDARPSARAPDRDVPPELDALCVAATAHDPAARPASARELSKQVQRYIDGDRDIALRRRLAGDQLALARTALDADDRRLAIQHAGRALALDPTNAEAAKLVGRIMIEPARETPAEVVAELDEIDDASLRRLSAVAVGGFAVYLAFIPLIAWAGFRDLTSLSLLAGASIANGAIAFLLLKRQQRASSAFLYAVVLGNVILIGMAGRLTSPFLVAPGLAATTMVGFAVHLRFGSAWLLGTALSAAVLGPWLAELVGLLPRTISSAGGSLVLTVSGGEFLLPQTEIALAIYVIAIVAVVGKLARAAARAQHESRRTIHLQAWHLRQLVPIADPKPHAA